MPLPELKNLSQPFAAINLTPMIDVVFLLIIFFMVVCQFIQSENFEISVPENIDKARTPADIDDQVVTVSVQAMPGGRAVYAVGSEVISPQDDIFRLIESMTDSLNQSFDTETPGKRIVNMRMSKDLTFAEYKAALAAVASSKAGDIQLAVLKDQKKIPEIPE
ncbi:protein TolR [Limihaloglobus sulfuriphilus]|uniref:Protein TolR n=1 Tax=Limihaloglobus sulfuriphilus TaxID=1851148 RepID=A0A1Q2MBZ7_9BACT|nr:biopolymer transporter ExbD [Limihaloglobus sulfuriphilus]AQQ70194.1 protein TolR [Limihaloglobus sulfuriphilus]